MPGLIEYALERTVAPTYEPLTLAACKHQCNLEIGETAFDLWFENKENGVGAMQAARECVERDAQVALMPQTWVLKLEEFPGEPALDLRIHPVRSLVVTYRDADGDSQTWNSSHYLLQRQQHRSLLVKADLSVDWPTVDSNRLHPITISLVAGFSDPTVETTEIAQRAKVPLAARQAMLLLVGHWFKHREAVLVGSINSQIELTYEHLIERLRTSRRYC